MKQFMIMSFGFLLVMIVGCKKEIQQNVIYDNVIYEIDDVDLYQNSSDKDRQKTPEQFLSLLYTDLFNQTIGGDALNQLSELILSVGDKGLMNKILLENALNDPNVDIPSTQYMLNDVDAFVDETYIRFFLRHPTEYEKYYFTNLIESDPDITPEMVYAAFVQSNEYLFY